MTREKFEKLVEQALLEIPRRFRTEMRNVAVVVEDEPSPELLAEMEIEPGDTLFGLYQGTPLPERSWAHGNNLPDRISIYQRPTEDACADDDEIRDCIAETVIHEFGHYFGLSEDEIEEIEEKFWRGESIENACRTGRASVSDSTFSPPPGPTRSSRRSIRNRRIAFSRLVRVPES